MDETEIGKAAEARRARAQQISRGGGGQNWRIPEQDLAHRQSLQAAFGGELQKPRPMSHQPSRWPGCH